MQYDWIGPAITLVLVLLFLIFGATALRKMRARRRLEFGEPEVAATARRDSAPQPLPQVPPGRVEAPQPEKAPPGDIPLAPAVSPPERDAAAADSDAEAAVSAAPEAEAAASAVTGEAAVAPAVVPDAVLKAGLAKTQVGLLGRINKLLGRQAVVDGKVLDELEEVLLTADVGVNLAMRFIDDLRARLKKRELGSADAVRDALRSQLLAALSGSHGSNGHGPQDVWHGPAKPKVILFVGVNGVGKTTTIGKIAAQLRAEGKEVLLAAGDTFRAAAAEQLAVWGERSQTAVIRGAEGADPASVIFKAVTAAVEQGVDVLLADTAGRLHTKTELMDEIKKVKKAASKAREGAPDETWLVVDATTGQNALQQAREFHQALGLTGVILTKLDGTAKGGVVVAIVDTLQIPVRFVGVGEQAGDLRPFNAQGFVSALFDGA